MSEEEIKQEEPVEEGLILSEPQYGVARLVTGEELLGPVSFGTMDGEMIVQFWNPLKVAKRMFMDGTEGKFLERYTSFSASPFITVSHNKIIHVSPLSEIGISYYHNCLTHIQTHTDKNEADSIKEMIDTLRTHRATAALKNNASKNDSGEVDEAELERIKKHYVEGTGTKH